MKRLTLDALKAIAKLDTILSLNSVSNEIDRKQLLDYVIASQ